jgi:hypothetical protein
MTQFARLERPSVILYRRIGIKSGCFFPASSSRNIMFAQYLGFAIYHCPRPSPFSVGMAMMS